MFFLGSPNFCTCLRPGFYDISEKSAKSSDYDEFLSILRTPGKSVNFAPKNGRIERQLSQVANICDISLENVDEILKLDAKA